MSGIELDFQIIGHTLEVADGVQCEYAECKSPYAFAYMDYIKANAFGSVHCHSKYVKANLLKTEKVQAFSTNQFLYIVRTLDGDAKVFRFYAPTGLLFTEAVTIVQAHYEMSTLDIRVF